MLMYDNFYCTKYSSILAGNFSQITPTIAIINHLLLIVMYVRFRVHSIKLKFTIE